MDALRLDGSTGPEGRDGSGRDAVLGGTHVRWEGGGYDSASFSRSLPFPLTTVVPEFERGGERGGFSPQVEYT